MDWKDTADWSQMPDVYVTRAQVAHDMFWRIEACSVPMALAPEVRLILATEHARLMAEKDARLAELEAMRAMNEAPRDGTPVLVKIKDDLSLFGIAPGGFGNTHAFCGLIAVMRNRGDISDWCFAAPVGRGGFPDEWLDGWWPLPRAAAIRALAEKET